MVAYSHGRFGKIDGNARRLRTFLAPGVGDRLKRGVQNQIGKGFEVERFAVLRDVDLGFSPRFNLVSARADFEILGPDPPPRHLQNENAVVPNGRRRLWETGKTNREAQR